MSSERAFSSVLRAVAALRGRRRLLAAVLLGGAALWWSTSDDDASRRADTASSASTADAGAIGLHAPIYLGQRPDLAARPVPQVAPAPLRERVSLLTGPRAPHADEAPQAQRLEMPLPSPGPDFAPGGASPAAAPRADRDRSEIADLPRVGPLRDGLTRRLTARRAAAPGATPATAPEAVSIATRAKRRVADADPLRELEDSAPPLADRTPESERSGPEPQEIARRSEQSESRAPEEPSELARGPGARILASDLTLEVLERQLLRPLPPSDLPRPLLGDETAVGSRPDIVLEKAGAALESLETVRRALDSDSPGVGPPPVELPAPTSPAADPSGPPQQIREAVRALAPGLPGRIGASLLAEAPLAEAPVGTPVSSGAAVPEPASGLLVALGLAGLGLRARTRRR